MGTLLTLATNRTTQSHIRYVTTVSPRSADGLVARVYRQVVRDFGMLAPPVSLHAPAPEVLAACWMMLRESLVATGAATRHDKEAVALAVSRANQCPYCVDVHGATLSGLSSASAAEQATADLPPGAPPELTGVAITFHYLNRMVNIFLTESPLPKTSQPVERRIRQVASRLMAALARADRPAGASLDLLPPAPVAPDLAWAQGNPALLEAFSRASATIDAAGDRSVPEPVRRLVKAQLAIGAPDTIDMSWMDIALKQLAVADRPAGRLALLTAFASYRVTPAVIAEFGQACPGPACLVEFTSWVSLTTARHLLSVRGEAK